MTRRLSYAACSSVGTVYLAGATLTGTAVYEAGMHGEDALDQLVHSESGWVNSVDSGSGKTALHIASIAGELHSTRSDITHCLSLCVSYCASLSLTVPLCVSHCHYQPLSLSLSRWHSRLHCTLWLVSIAGPSPPSASTPSFLLAPFSLCCLCCAVSAVLSLRCCLGCAAFAVLTCHHRRYTSRQVLV